MDEVGTRLVSWQQVEFAHAHNRPPAERHPHPQAGDRLWLRRYDWNHHPESGQTIEPVLVVVVEAQDPADTSLAHYAADIGPVRDPNLWQVVRDFRGRPVYDGGVVRYAPAADPWPWVRVRGWWPPWIGAKDEERESTTREARLRGSAGWLPLNYRDLPHRWRLPGATVAVPQPVSSPLSTPAPAS